MEKVVEKEEVDSKPKAKVQDDDKNAPANEKEEENEKENEDEEDEGPSENDLVIRDNFPALRIPTSGSNNNSKKKKSKPMIEGVDPIPRYKFWSMENTIHFSPEMLSTLQQDCETVFTARDKPDGSAYSAGQTFFLPANMKPRCALEALAQCIFQQHTAHLEEGTFNPAQSGANWWTLVMDANNNNKNHNPNHPSKSPLKKDDDDNEEEEEEEDEVALHFDADYELEEQTSNLLLHPRVATVTYLSNVGAPTLILDQPSPPMDDLKKTTLEKGISKAWLSHPRLGKHTAFDGRLLHGAPALFFPSQKHYSKEQVQDETNEKPAKRQKVTPQDKRYTLLVNIWLNHWVMDAGILDEEICAKLKTPWESPERANSNLKRGDDEKYIPAFEWNYSSVDLSKVVDTDWKKVILSPNESDPAGEDELALCNHNVIIKYNPTMEECHAAASGIVNATATANGNGDNVNVASTVEMQLKEGAITLHVGEELEDASDEENDE